MDVQLLIDQAFCLKIDGWVMTKFFLARQMFSHLKAEVQLNLIKILRVLKKREHPKLSGDFFGFISLIFNHWPIIILFNY